jgi:exodeoxyribonuclease VII small subunit
MAATDPTPADDVSGLSYEAARAELVDIVARLEGGQVGLEDSMALWKRGEALAQHCEGWLQRAESTIREGGPTAPNPT